MNEIEEYLQQTLIREAAQILKVEESVVEWSADIDEYGFGSMEVNGLCVQLNEFFSISIQPVLFLEVTSLEALSQYLLQEFPAEIERRCLATS
jgi:acyl carrier protein